MSVYDLCEPCRQTYIRNTSTQFSISGLVKVSYSASGNRHVSGDVGLKASQTYPSDFGVAIANMYLGNLDVIGDMAMNMLQHADPKLAESDWEWLWGDLPDDPWADAHLGSVFALLRSMALRGH